MTVHPLSGEAPASGSKSVIRLPALARRRRSTRLAGAALAVLAGAAITGAWAARTSRTTAALAVTRAVPAGVTITAADVRTVQVRPGGLDVVTSAEAAVGRAAAVDLLAGTLLTEAMLTGAAVPGPGEAVVGLVLAAGSFPDQLEVGSTVDAVAAPSTATDPDASPITVRGRVLSLRPGDGEDGSLVVSLLVPATEAAVLSRAGVGGEVTLVLLPPGQGSP